MKKAEINAILDKTSIKDLVYKQPRCAWTIRRLLSKELGDIKCPSETGIKTYIKNHFNLVWDEEKDLWIPYKEDTNSTKKGRKKGGKKPSKTLSISSQIKIVNANNSTIADGNLPINDISTNFNLSEKSNKNLGQNSNFLESKNEEKTTSNSTENKSTKKGRKKGEKKSTETFTKTHEIEIDDNNNYNIEDSNQSLNGEKNTSANNKNKNCNNTNSSLKSKKIDNVDTSTSIDSSSNLNLKSKYKNEDPSLYLQHLESNGSKKYSLSLSPFVVDLIEEIILEKYNKKQMNKSKIVQLALIEFITINTRYASNDA